MRTSSLRLGPEWGASFLRLAYTDDFSKVVLAVLATPPGTGRKKQRRTTLDSTASTVGIFLSEQDARLSFVNPWSTFNFCHTSQYEKRGACTHPGPPVTLWWPGRPCIRMPVPMRIGYTGNATARTVVMPLMGTDRDI